MPKVVELGLNLDTITINKLEEIASLMESYIREYIFNKLGSRLEQLNITLSLDITDVLRVRVEVEVIGRSKGRINYDSLIDEAVREAYRRIEEVLRKYAKGDKREDTDTEGDSEKVQ